MRARDRLLLQVGISCRAPDRHERLVSGIHILLELFYSCRT
jgi:hypothetical protein